MAILKEVYLWWWAFETQKPIIPFPMSSLCLQYAGKDVSPSLLRQDHDCLSAAMLSHDDYGLVWTCPDKRFVLFPISCLSPGALSQQ